MRRMITGVALAALTVAMLVPGSPARAATTGPTLTIDTPGPLEDLQSVTMAGTGLTPGETLWFMECQRWGSNLCTYWSGVSGAVDASGHLTITAPVHRFIHDYMDIPPPIDCAYDDCRFAFVRQGDYVDGYRVVAETVGRFARTDSTSLVATIEAPPPLPAVVTTRVLGRGFTPGSRVAASRCVSTPAGAPGPVTDSCDEQESATADANGAVAVPIELRRFRAGTDCVDPQRVCSVRLDGPEYAATARVALVFDPTSFPPPAPTITLAPQPVRHVAATVTVTGQGFRPLHPVEISGPNTYASATADSVGSFTTTIEVQRYARPTDIDAPVLDCATAGACAITASTGPDDVSASAPITFAAHSDDSTLILDATTVKEGNGNSQASFRVHLDRPASVPVRFAYLADGDPDLGWAFGLETIPVGQTDLTVPFTVHGDRLDEPDHHTGFKIIELTGAQLSGPPMIPITVRDDDPRPAVRVGSTTVRETDGPQFVSLPVTLSAPSGRDVTVDYVTHHDTARASHDYVRTRGTLTIPAGQTSGRIPIVVLGDRTHERSERFRITIDDAVHARIADGEANVTIHDDD